MSSEFTPPDPLSDPQPILHLEAEREKARIPFLSWDTEGGQRAQTNLLRPQEGMTLRCRVGSDWFDAHDLGTTREDSAGGTIRYRINVLPNAEIRWELRLQSRPAQLDFTLSGHGGELTKIEQLEVIFPFNPRVTPTTAFPAEWEETGKLRLPVVLSAPDFGQMLLVARRGHERVKARLEGSREKGTVDFVLELAGTSSDAEYEFQFTPTYLPHPESFDDPAVWRKIRRAWFNGWQPSSRWGEQDRPFSAPPGILANNVISDPASLSLWFYADHAFWFPTIAPGISIAALLRKSIDWWLANRLDSNGEVVGYWDHKNFLDSNPSLLISSWDYVESTGNLSWLEKRIETLELLSSFLERRDVDGDGLVEATQSGNRGTLFQPSRGCSWWDTINSGHKDGYTNAMIYRAWRCLSDLERQLGRHKQQRHYRQLADRLKSAYMPVLFNEKTGWLGWWRSEDGELHDYATPVVNGLAIAYGLIEPEDGRKMLSRLWEKIRAAGFTRLDLGLPCTLDPIQRNDYLQPDTLGLPQREDGTDTFGQYMNGGISAGHTVYFLAAHYVVDDPEPADRLLKAMLDHQTEVGFHNGVRNESHKGIDWTTWDGKPCGYEGYLSDVFGFLQGFLLRSPQSRRRLFRPLMELA